MSFLKLCNEIIVQLYSFSLPNKSPTVRLIQEVYEELKRQTDENKGSILEIQKDLQNELLIVKNFTSKIIKREKGKYSLSPNGARCILYN